MSLRLKKKDLVHRYDFKLRRKRLTVHFLIVFKVPSQYGGSTISFVLHMTINNDDLPITLGVDKLDFRPGGAKQVCHDVRNIMHRDLHNMSSHNNDI